jgi:hypothetical protein
MNPFEQLRLVHDAPHQAFEEASASLIRATTKDTSRVRVYKGDGGVDVFTGTWGDEGQLDVYQIKYFPDPWAAAQKKQIRESYKTASNNPRFTLRSWTLCVPTRLTQDDWEWLHKWSRGKTNIKVWDADKLSDFLYRPECADVRRRLIGLGVRGLPEMSSELAPEIYIHQLDSPPLGFALAIRLTNTGGKTAHHVRATVSHSDTGCVSWRQDEHWWTDTGNGVLNPRLLTANLPINPDETIPVLSIPFRSDVAFPVWVRLRLTAEDYPAYEATAEVSASQIVSGQRVTFSDSKKPKSDQFAVSEPGKTKNPSATKLLDAILAHDNAGERGLVVVPNVGLPDHISFVANVARPGALMAMAPEEFNEGVAELISLGWLLNPSTVGNRVKYAANPRLPHC